MTDYPVSSLLKRGVIVTLVGLGGFALWAGAGRLDGAVVTQGHVTLDKPAQVVQHLDGGLVAALHVRDGAIVQVGDPILTLDGTELALQHGVAARALVEALARGDRLLAEIEGAATVLFRTDLMHAAGTDPQIAALLTEEIALFNARRTTLDQHAAQLSERARQSSASVSGLERQLEALDRQRALAHDDLARQTALLERGLTEAARLSALEREVARLDGQIGEVEASIAEARSAIAGFDLERLTRLATFGEQAQSELNLLRPQIAELRDQLRLIEQRRERLILRAPMAGAVLEVSAHTIGGVIAPREVVARIQPEGTARHIAVQIAPSDVDRVWAGQTAQVRFSSMGAMHTPEATGTLRHVSADAVIDPASGRRVFRAEIALNDMTGFTPQPGQPAEVFVTTDSRSPASFLLKPMADYWAYAMRER